MEEMAVAEKLAEVARHILRCNMRNALEGLLAPVADVVLYFVGQEDLFEIGGESLAEAALGRVGSQGGAVGLLRE